MAWFMFFVTLFNQLYSFFGATLGGLLGSGLVFDSTGIEFVMMAMFIVIFLENWQKEKEHTSSLIGLGVGVVLYFFMKRTTHPSQHGIDFTDFDRFAP